MKNRAQILKLALLATGFSGIVAEYVYATLATYFLGDSVVQWAMIISVMLFSMGLGSRISKYISKNLFTTFVIVEFILSILVAFSALSVYSVAAVSRYTGFVIYILSIATALLIGMELPLAVRLNEKYEELKINVSSILEKDYYGSLLGGLFFSFVGLPYLGLTYTPFVLGFINLLVAIVLLNYFPKSLSNGVSIRLNVVALIVALTFVIGSLATPKIIRYGEQQRYEDKIVLSEQSKYQKIVVTQWKDNYWLYLNHNLQFSSYDEVLYHEVLVHPAMSLSKNPRSVLVLGGGDGCAVRELLKYDKVQDITLIDIDKKMTDIAQNHPIFKGMNKNALNHPKVKIVNTDGFVFLEKDTNYYDVIIADLPDPRTIELARLYSMEYYKLCYRHLRPNGVIVTQAGSPYYAAKSFSCIKKTISAAGFSTIPVHNQIITMGEWGWVIGAKNNMSPKHMIEQMKQVDYNCLNTKWLNSEAISMITSFGKDFFMEPGDSVEINKIHHPVLYKYYMKGNWDLY
ncbi:MAG: polyamine aminopropyltransferase [Bacteroidales bacterium]|nr:polyamine aminopropyltransferase [Bacteroidales bacterium]